MITIPEDFIEFLHWVKETTEAFWSGTSSLPHTTTVPYEWMINAKWIGMTEAEIDETENKYNIRFSRQHRDLLRILHTIDNKVLVPHPGRNIRFIQPNPIFYNWLEDGEQIKEMLLWPYDTVAKEITQDEALWPEIWGERPENPDEKIRAFTTRYQQAPKLLPLMGHKFLVSREAGNDGHTDEYNEVLSVYGRDTVVYASDLKRFILHELYWYLGLVVGEEKGSYINWEQDPDIPTLVQQQAQSPSIPFWEDLFSMHKIPRFKIPEDHVEFLQWVKTTTEANWSGPGYQCGREIAPEPWIRGAEWIGMTEEQILATEAKYNIRFSDDHKHFLRILHTIDRKVPASYDEDGDLASEEHYLFFNWLEEGEDLIKYLSWPFDTIFQDVAGVNGVWVKSWGEKPATEEEQKAMFREWYEAAPRLLPLTGHRFVVNDDVNERKPVLSVWGSDIIVYGWSIRSYLLKEINEHIGLLEPYEEEYDGYKWAGMGSAKQLGDLYRKDYDASKTKSIPYWEDVILYWSSGWSSFGKEFPYPEDGPKLIVKAQEDDDPAQKTFTPF